MLVVGSANSSNSMRLVEVAERAGCPACSSTALRTSRRAGSRRATVGVTAGASAPESLVQGVVRALDGLGGASVSERTVATETVHFKLPAEVRKRRR